MKKSEKEFSLHMIRVVICVRETNEQAAHAIRAYEGTLIFDNDFAALLPDTVAEKSNESDLITAQGEPGICRVICFSPLHDLTISRMNAADVRGVVDAWVEQYEELAGSRSLTGCRFLRTRAR